MTSALPAPFLTFGTWAPRFAPLLFSLLDGCILFGTGLGLAGVPYDESAFLGFLCIIPPACSIILFTGFLLFLLAQVYDMEEQHIHYSPRHLRSRDL